MKIYRCSLCDIAIIFILLFALSYFDSLLIYIKFCTFFTGEAKKQVDDLEAELEADLDDLKLDDIDTTDVNLDDEELLED